MIISDLQSLKQGEKILILGIGKENRQFLDWLIKVVKFSPGKIILADKVKPSEKVDFISDSRQIYGLDYLEILKNDNIKYVFKAPGIWSYLPEIVAFRHKHGVDSVHSSLVFFWQKYREKIIAITGTKGKSTVSSLTNHLINSVGVNFNNNIASVYCGNTTGISPYTYWQDLDSKVDPDKYFVVEISSFQLEDLGFSKSSPELAGITNYYIDHLDQHKDEIEYWQSKDNIFKFQSDKDTTVTTSQVLEKTQNPDILKSKIVLDQGYFEQIKSLFQTNLVGQHNLSNLSLAVTLSSLALIKNVDRTEHLPSTALIPSSKEGLYPQEGNLFGILTLLNKYKNAFQTAILSYKPLSHRLEKIVDYKTLVKVYDQIIPVTISFIDDGYATEPDAVAAAIDSCIEDSSNFLWLQISGKDKGSNFDSISKSVSKTRQLRRLVQIDYCGEVGLRLAKTLEDGIENLKVKAGGNFHSTLDMCLLPTYIETQLGDFLQTVPVVPENPRLWFILSPCGSSFDEFVNYEERSKWWVEKVKNYVSERLAEQESILI